MDQTYRGWFVFFHSSLFPIFNDASRAGSVLLRDFYTGTRVLACYAFRRKRNFLDYEKKPPTKPCTLSTTRLAVTTTIPSVDALKAS
mmetsp:Transcript_5225/g.8258  ORF Transcript_5225/g.8258 Transcript_5225/m.8258 type:complete len:87 (-) Transcript_5225:821-1081(-)